VEAVKNVHLVFYDANGVLVEEHLTDPFRAGMLARAFLQNMCADDEQQLDGSISFYPTNEPVEDKQ
jgi:hypothetical protein